MGVKEVRQLSANLGGAVPWGPVLESTASHGYGADMNVGVKSCRLPSFKAVVLFKGVNWSFHRVA